MNHFHVMRWGAMQVETGESIAVTDADFAAVESPQEAESLVSRVVSLGDRCVTVACQEAICTMHPARFAV